MQTTLPVILTNVLLFVNKASQQADQIMGYIVCTSQKPASSIMLAMADDYNLVCVFNGDCSENTWKKFPNLYPLLRTEHKSNCLATVEETNDEE